MPLVHCDTRRRRSGWWDGVRGKKALTCTPTPESTKQVTRVPRHAPVHCVKWEPAPGWARITTSPLEGRNVASQASSQESDPEPYTETLPLPAIVSARGSVGCRESCELPNCGCGELRHHRGAATCCQPPPPTLSVPRAGPASQTWPARRRHLDARRRGDGTRARDVRTV
jgi:hypothetical protein